MAKKMDWIGIKHGDFEAEAIDCLDGILVRDPMRFGMTYIPGWKVQLQAGDMDAPGLRRRKTTPPTYHVAIVPEKS